MSISKSMNRLTGVWKPGPRSRALYWRLVSFRDSLLTRRSPGGLVGDVTVMWCALEIGEGDSLISKKSSTIRGPGSANSLILSRSSVGSLWKGKNVGALL